MNATITPQSKIITIFDLPITKQTLPKSWVKAAGLLHQKRKSIESHLKKVRQEWDHKTLNK